MEEVIEMQIVVIKHTEVFRGDHADPVRVSYVFNENSTLGDVLKTLSNEGTRNKEWFEIPVQGNGKETSNETQNQA